VSKPISLMKFIESVRGLLAVAAERGGDPAAVPPEALGPGQ
jgi:hypothetical protein